MAGIAYMFTDGNIKLGSRLRHAVNIVKRRNALDVLRLIVLSHAINQPHRIRGMNMVAQVKGLHGYAIAYLVPQRREKYLVKLRRSANVQAEIIETLRKQLFDQRQILFHVLFREISENWNADLDLLSHRTAEKYTNSNAQCLTNDVMQRHFKAGAKAARIDSCIAAASQEEAEEMIKAANLHCVLPDQNIGEALLQILEVGHGQWQVGNVRIFTYPDNSRIRIQADENVLRGVAGNSRRADGIQAELRNDDGVLGIEVVTALGHNVPL